MEFLVIDDPLKFYNLMLNDIVRAKQFIYLETYKFANDYIGIKFRDALTRKAHHGIKVKVLIDSWGRGPVSESFCMKIMLNVKKQVYFILIKQSQVLIPQDIDHPDIRVFWHYDFHIHPAFRSIDQSFS